MRIRKRVHIGYAIVMLLFILGFRIVNKTSVIDTIFTVAGYTYGPLLGLFAFGFLTKRNLKGKWIIPLITICAPLLCYLIAVNSVQWLNGYKFGYELILLNGLVTFLGLLLISKPDKGKMFEI
jgi:peptidoglycan/LPS O-acetylase OafA/YrhL